MLLTPRALFFSPPPWQTGDFPKFFDFRTTWWGCGVTVHNQGQCGSCWASSAISVLNDRFCIHKDINDDPLEVTRDGAGAANRAFMDAGSCDKVGEPGLAIVCGFVLSCDNMHVT